MERLSSAVLICRVWQSEKKESLMRCMCSFERLFTGHIGSQGARTGILTLALDLVQVHLDFLLDVHVDRRQVARAHLQTAAAGQTRVVQIAAVVRGGLGRRRQQTALVVGHRYIRRLQGRKPNVFDLEPAHTLSAGGGTYLDFGFVMHWFSDSSESSCPLLNLTKAAVRSRVAPWA